MRVDGNTASPPSEILMRILISLLLLCLVRVLAFAQDSATVLRLASDLSDATIRITGRFGRVEVRRPEIAFDGIRYAAGSAKLDSSSNIDLPPVLLWQEIDRIERRTSATSRGALIGGGIGLVLAVATIASNSDCSGLGAAQVCTAADAASILAVPVGVGIGALVGSRGHRWKSVYQRP